MPYTIRKIGKGYYVIGPNGERKNSKPYSSRQAAMPYFRKLQMVAHKEKK